MPQKNIPFHYTYANLPERFYQNLKNTNFRQVHLLKWNAPLAQELGLTDLHLTETEKAEYFSASKLMPGAKPIAQAYSGHQFGNFNPHLGDGRALLLGELRDSKNNLRDIHLKGSGPTQFSRRGDGYAQISAVIREYLLSESMFYLNIPTTRTLAIMTTGEWVEREFSQAGALQVRVASSHIRIGTFEHFVARKDFEAVNVLANFVIDRHHNDLPKTADGYLELFKRIMKMQIDLISKWLSVGFIHGVMNTDNTAISGETIDFGPCAFMEEYNPLMVFSSIDKQGRYAYGRQPSILKWNLSVLGHCFLTLVDPDIKTAESKIEAELNEFDSLFQNQWLNDTAKKFGLKNGLPEDTPLFESFFNWMLENKYDFTLSFRFLSRCLVADETTLLEIKKTFNIDYTSKAFENWFLQWKDKVKARVNAEKLNLDDVIKLMNSVNPAYIARNHRVEEAIKAAVEQNDMTVFEKFLATLQAPFIEKAELEEFLHPAKENEKVSATFCNT